MTAIYTVLTRYAIDEQQSRWINVKTWKWITKGRKLSLIKSIKIKECLIRKIKLTDNLCHCT